jgi:hypothetical protein
MDMLNQMPQTDAQRDYAQSVEDYCTRHPEKRIAHRSLRLIYHMMKRFPVVQYTPPLLTWDKHRQLKVGNEIILPADSVSMKTIERDDIRVVDSIINLHLRTVVDGITTVNSPVAVVIAKDGSFLQVQEDLYDTILANIDALQAEEKRRQANPDETHKLFKNILNKDNLMWFFGG